MVQAGLAKDDAAATGLLARLKGLNVGDNTEEERKDAIFQFLMDHEAGLFWEVKLTDAVKASSNKPIIARSKLNSVEVVTEWLNYLGFFPEKADAWVCLGLFRKACGGHPDIVLNRAQQAYTVLQLVSRIAPSAALEPAIQSIRMAIDKACRSCTADLDKPVALADRLMPWSQPFGEISHEGLMDILEVVPPGTVTCTQLSDLMDGPAPDLFRLQGRQAGQLIQDCLQSPDAVKSCTLRDLLMWCPSPSDVGRMLLNYGPGLNMRKDAPPWGLHLIVPLASHFNGLGVKEIKDIWNHTLLTKRWESYIQQVEVIRKPARVILPSTGPPVYVYKQLCVFSLSPAPLAPWTGTPMGRPPVGNTVTAAKDVGFYADVATRKAIALRKVLSELLEGIPHIFGLQERSPGSAEEEARVRLSVVIPEGGISDFDLLGIFTILRRSNQIPDVLLARKTLFGDKLALIGEMSAPSAVRDVVHLCSEIAFIDGKRFIARTDRSPEAWAERLHQQFLDSPEAVVIVVRPRPSRGGRPWASSPLSKSHASAAAKGPRQLLATEQIIRVQLEGPSIFDASKTFKDLFDALPGGSSLSQIPQDTATEPGQWSVTTAGVFSDFVGSAVLQAHDEAEAARYSELLENMVVDAGSATLAVSAKTEAAIAEEGKNSSRRGRQLAPPKARR